MKRRDPSQPFLSWCMIARGRSEHDAELLERCLRSLRERTPDAEIVIVDTMSPRADFIEVARCYADVWVEYKGPRGDWTTEMHAFDDAAAARQLSFELASGVWRGWIDADDQLPDPAIVKRLLKLNAKLTDLEGYKAPNVVGDPSQTVGLEGYIKQITDKFPDVTYFTAAYLYQTLLENDFAKKCAPLKALPPVEEWPDDVGIAVTWENAKTRIVKWGDVPAGEKTRWLWREAGHEVLVPRDPAWREKSAHLLGLLFVHRKKFSPEDDRYSLERHFKILYGQYQNGERSSRNLLYLANFARGLCPDMEATFLADAHRASVLPMERTRTLVELGAYAARSGLYHDAREAYGGAVQFRGDLPDPWLAGAEAAMEFEDWQWAAEWYGEALRREIGPDSLLSPRQHALRTPLRAAQALIQIAKGQVKQGLHGQAEVNLKAALDLALKAADHPAAGPDRVELVAHATCIEQDLNAQRAAVAIYNLWRNLINNDETEKAAELIKSAPYLLEDHPLVLEMEEWAIPIRKHLTDEEAYKEHYHDEIGSMATHDDRLVDAPMYRAFDISEWLRLNAPRAEVCEVGSYDGLVCIPVLRRCPGVRYTAVDASEKVLVRLRDNAKRLVDDGDARLTTYVGTDAIATMINAATELPIKQYDAVIFCEVLEHVQNPVVTLKHLASLCKPTGMIFLSTPWGAYDRGHPANTYDGLPRDHRGHVRAITARNMYEWLKTAKIVPIEMKRTDGNFGIGDTMFVKAAPQLQRPKHLNIAVRGALWDWNGRSVATTGIGASEEMIIQLTEGVSPAFQANVFGPTADHDVFNSVGYWKHPQLRFADGKKIVISRAPGWAAEVDKYARRKLRKILWLQDAFYPDLNPKTAADYERIVVVSEWHKELMHEKHGVPMEQMEVIYNWVLPRHFESCEGDKDVVREPHHFIYASSPDRGLLTLLRLWPDIRKLYPDATLDIFYGWKGCVKLGQGDAAWIKRFTATREEYNRLRWQLGVFERGMVPHTQIAHEFMRASAWLYPSTFLETCLHGDSEISIPGDHSNGFPPRVKIKDLVGKSGFPVYAFDEKKNRFCIATAKRVWKTKEVQETIALTLDDGKKLRCTPEHKLLTFDGDWIESGQVIVGTRLRALHHLYDVLIRDANGTWKSESRLVGEWKAGRKLRSNEHVDHLDPTRLDNRPDALQVLSASEHFKKTHTGKSISKKAEKRRCKAWRKWANTPEGKANIVARCKKTARKFWRDLAADPVRRAAFISSRTEAIRQACARNGTHPGSQGKNHKVVAVERITEVVEVYDMEVEKYHNFIAEGVVVHNCCTNAIKARAAGCVPVTTPLAALNETAACRQAQLIDPEGIETLTDDYKKRFLDGVVAAVETPEAERAEMSRIAIAAHCFEQRLPAWLKLLEE